MVGGQAGGWWQPPPAFLLWDDDAGDGIKMSRLTSVGQPWHFTGMDRMDLNNLRYQHIERALMRHYDVKFPDQKAFKARLRHFRNLGVPCVEKVGKGTQITYTRRNLWEILLALELNKLGVAPATAALAVSTIGDRFSMLMVSLDCQPADRLLLLFKIEEFGPKPADIVRFAMKMMTARRYADELLSGGTDWSYIVLEFSRSIRSAEGWLNL